MIKFIKLSIWFFTIFIIVFFVNYKNSLNKVLEKDVDLIVESGENLTSVLSGDLNYPKFFVKLFFYFNPENKIDIQSGRYNFLAGEDINSIIKTFKYGAKIIDEKLTILEGRNIFDIDNYLTNFNLINENEFISESKSVGKYKENFPFLENALTLEGYLYPDTYFINLNSFDLQNFIELMLNNFNNRVYSSLLKNLTEEEKNQIITIASILEKEEKNETEKPIVAGILFSRLNKNMMLGADITACYAYNLTSEDCKLNLSKYIKEENDYNTRAMVGLPKTPISNPSANSIEACINREKTDYLYYLHDSEGKIHYAKTNEEHIQNKYLYIK